MINSRVETVNFWPFCRSDSTGRSKANSIIISSETIYIHQDTSYNDADNQKSQNAAIPAQTLKSCVHSMTAPDLVYTILV